MVSTVDARKTKRVSFDKGFDCRIMSIDGTWQRACILWDVSSEGGKLSITGDVANLSLKEFFLILSSSGRAYRRCTLIWINGEQIGIKFLSS